jgi:hypothetical protein
MVENWFLARNIEKLFLERKVELFPLLKED